MNLELWQLFIWVMTNIDLHLNATFYAQHLSLKSVYETAWLWACMISSIFHDERLELLVWGTCQERSIEHLPWLFYVSYHCLQFYEDSSYSCIFLTMVSKTVRLEDHEQVSSPGAELNIFLRNPSLFHGLMVLGHLHKIRTF